jgi:pentatricopeptide repeat protein
LSLEIEVKEHILDIMWNRRDMLSPKSNHIYDLLTLYRKAGMTKKANDLFAKMKARGVKRTYITYNSMMKCNAHDLAIVDSLHRDMIIEGITPTLILCNSLMHIYSSHANLTRVDDMYSRMIEESFIPDVFTFNTMIHAHAMHGSLKRVEELYDRMLKDGISPDVFVYSSLIHAYSNQGDLQDVNEVYDRMLKEGIKPNLFTYNVMIHAYSKHNCVDQAAGMYTSLKEAGCVPNEVTFCTLIDCYAKTEKNLDEILHTLKEMTKYYVKPNVYIWGSLIDGFTRMGDPLKALAIWKYLLGLQSFESLDLDMPINTVPVILGAQIVSLAIDSTNQASLLSEAREIWRYVQENDSIPLDANVLTSYVECLASFGAEEALEAVELIKMGVRGEGMPRRCVRPDQKTVLNAIEKLGENGLGKEAGMLEGVKVEG